MTEKDQFYPVLLSDAKMCQVHHETGVGGSGSGNCCESARSGGVSGARGASTLGAGLLLLRFGR